MSCPGLHCPGCSGGQTVGITATTVVGLVVAAETVQWVAERIVWISATMAMCFILTVAAGIWLERLADRRGARFAAVHGILSRADVILPYPVRVTAVPATTTRPDRRAADHGQHLRRAIARAGRGHPPDATRARHHRRHGGMMAFDPGKPDLTRSATSCAAGSLTAPPTGSRPKR